MTWLLRQLANVVVRLVCAGQRREAMPRRRAPAPPRAPERERVDAILEEAWWLR